jgi:hypothetical protein
MSGLGYGVGRAVDMRGWAGVGMHHIDGCMGVGIGLGVLCGGDVLLGQGG